MINCCKNCSHPFSEICPLCKSSDLVIKQMLNNDNHLFYCPRCVFLFEEGAGGEFQESYCPDCVAVARRLAGLRPVQEELGQVPLSPYRGRSLLRRMFKL